MPIKSLIIITLLLGGCITKKPVKIEIQRSEKCQNELKSAVSDLIGARNLKVSKDIFSKTPYLYLTNKIVGDRRGKKTILLYKKEDKLYIGLIDSNENIIREVEVAQCQSYLH